MRTYNFVILVLIYFQVNVPAQQKKLSESKILVPGVQTYGLPYETNGNIKSKEILDTLYSFPSPGIWPCGLAWDGQYIWNCDAVSQLIYKLSVTGDVISAFPVPDTFAVGGLEWDGENLWLAGEQSAVIYKIDTATGLPINQFLSPSFDDPDPNGFGLAWDGEFLWHSVYGDSAMIYKLNPENGQILGAFIPPKKSILGITWSGDHLYGISIEWALSGGMIYKFEPATGIVLDSSYWEVPYPLGLVWDGEYFWNSSGRANPNGNGGNERIYQVSNTITSIKNGQSYASINYILKQNYPNPFNPTTKISWQVPAGSWQTLKIYDVLGNEIATLVSEGKPAGSYEITWNAENLTSGIYFYQLQVGDFTETKKMILIK